jgi:hypothetical protein
MSFLMLFHRCFLACPVPLGSVLRQQNPGLNGEFRHNGTRRLQIFCKDQEMHCYLRALTRLSLSGHWYSVGGRHNLREHQAEALPDGMDLGVGCGDRLPWYVPASHKELDEVRR